jgi:hypothetical protein
VGSRASYGVKSGSSVKAFHMRATRASEMLMGGRPSTSSIVATMDAVS